jgi:hypothetical protein
MTGYLLYDPVALLYLTTSGGRQESPPTSRCVFLTRAAAEQARDKLSPDEVPRCTIKEITC